MASALSQAKKLAAYNNKLEQKNVALQYSYNKSLAEQDRSWQERMANSAHQRETADLKAAGLNPVLSITGGNGSATPSGSSASVSKPSVDMSLPRAVMDMAIAQLNSATALQTTAMNNANALQVVAQQGIENRKTQSETPGYTWFGQLRNAPKLFAGLQSNIASSSSKAKKGLETYNQYMNAYAQYVSSYEEIKKRGLPVSKSETKKYKKYKKYLTRNGLYAKKYK